jgi:hypothetical protein
MVLANPIYAPKHMLCWWPQTERVAAALMLACTSTRTRTAVVVLQSLHGDVQCMACTMYGLQQCMACNNVWPAPCIAITYDIAHMLPRQNLFFYFPCAAFWQAVPKSFL